MIATVIGNSNRVVVKDRFDKWITYDFTFSNGEIIGAKMVEKTGDNWTGPRLKMAWNMAKKEMENHRLKTSQKELEDFWSRSKAGIAA